MNVVILGLGEVGSALESICKDAGHKTYVIEKEWRDNFEEKIDVMLVNIPYFDDFPIVVSAEINNINPKLVIINSTVNVGVTRLIQETVGEEITVTHSPVRGVHPNLKEGIKTFVKYVGATDPDKAEEAIEFLEGLGIKTRAFNSPEETEMFKLLSTTTYGIYIAWATEIKRICDKHKLDFDNVYTDGNLTYNVGYMELQMPWAVRPILKPNVGGFFGHCVYENTQLLDKKLQNKWKIHIDDIGKGKK